MSDFVNVPREWLFSILEMFEPFTSERMAILEMLAAAPKAEPVKMSRKAITEIITGFSADYYACETAGPSLKGDWNEALRLADQILALYSQPEAPKVEHEPVWVYDMVAAHRDPEWVEKWGMPDAHPAPASDELLEALEQITNTTDHRTGFSDLCARRAAHRVASEAIAKHKGPQS